MPRDRAFEHRWLAELGGEQFAAAVQARLERASAELGEDSFRSRTLPDLLEEVQEELLDVAGWGVLAAQLDVAPGTSARATARALEVIAATARLAAGAEQMIRELQHNRAAVTPPR